ncbi:MAG TPA: 4-phosphoerythronate dehydrogenase [Melioribacteraceae bacterium]|nr:4-phosphoerythronate dehydrogenase [Melioribacteraceae bacterium]
MNILADENIPQVKEAFSNFGEVRLSHGRHITGEMLRDTDVLIVRSITDVNRNLLDGSNIKFVGTATIGTDHIDKEYLRSRVIYFADAAGCNSYSVAEYVIRAVAKIFTEEKKSFVGKTFGIVGYGNIGTKVAVFARALGFETVINDPPLERKLGKENFRSLSDALQCDVVTFHVPLNKSGIDKTVHLLNEKNIAEIKSGALLINTSRGPVIKNSVLKKRLLENRNIRTVLDVWENEPVIDTELLGLVDIASAHIAGYSLEGKLNGTLFIYNKFCGFMNCKPEWKPDYPQIEEPEIAPDKIDGLEELIDEITGKVYDISLDTELIKKIIAINPEERGRQFDQLRKTYRIRREFNNYSVKSKDLNNTMANVLTTLRFRLT